jgi:putative endonuclease
MIRGAASVLLRMDTPSYWVYILANVHRTIYIGVTSDLNRRLDQHLRGEGSAFVQRYGLTRLVYAEQARSALDAIRREKQLKRWTRPRKVALIQAVNPNWLDWAWGGPPTAQPKKK